MPDSPRSSTLTREKTRGVRDIEWPFGLFFFGLGEGMAVNGSRKNGPGNSP
jgi:hypothetical protein